MKKLMTVLFSLVLVFSLAMPIFAQDTTAKTDTGTTAPKKEKKSKMKKSKKEKKAEKMDKMDKSSDTTK